jgi:hypothetical protein
MRGGERPKPVNTLRHVNVLDRGAGPPPARSGAGEAIAEDVPWWL